MGGNGIKVGDTEPVEITDCYVSDEDMTKAMNNFISGYCERSKITRKQYDEYFIAAPCNCGEPECNGFATESRQSYNSVACKLIDAQAELAECRRDSERYR